MLNSYPRHEQQPPAVPPAGTFIHLVRLHSTQASTGNFDQDDHLQRCLGAFYLRRQRGRWYICLLDSRATQLYERCVRGRSAEESLLKHETGQPYWNYSAQRLRSICIEPFSDKTLDHTGKCPGERVCKCLLGSACGSWQVLSGLRSKALSAATSAAGPSASPRQWRCVIAQ